MSNSQRHFQNRHRSAQGAAIADAGFIAARFGPKSVVITGLVGFLCFYVAGPYLLESWLESSEARLSAQNSAGMGHVLDAFVSRPLVRPSQWIDVSILILCSVIALRKFARNNEIPANE